MFKYVLGLLLLALVAAGIYQNRDAIVSPFIRHVELTDTPPPGYFFVQDVEGRSHELGELRGRQAVLVLWATWCESCPKVLKQLTDLRDQSEGKLKVIAMNIDVVQANADPRDATTKSVAEVRDYCDNNQIVLPVWTLKGKGVQGWIKASESRLTGAEIRLPQIYVFDKDLRVRWFGIAPYRGEVEAAVKQVTETE